MDHVQNELGNFFVPILGQSGSEPPDLRLIGSGTLVQINGVRYILTAAHVWHRANDFEIILLGLASRAVSLCPIPRTHIVAKELWSEDDARWGPDLALLAITQSHASTIGAHKSFLNLSQQRAVLLERPSEIDKKLCAITGMEGETSMISPDPGTRTIDAHINCQAFFSAVNCIHDHGEYDYLDIGVQLTLPGVPFSFGGVSGGGLWEIDLLRNKSGEILWNGKKYFRGVAFWQSERSDGRRVIRCHGPRSIFEKAWIDWELAEAVER